MEFFVGIVSNLYGNEILLIIYFFHFSERRMKVTDEDFRKSKENVLYRKQEGTPEGLYL